MIFLRITDINIIIVVSFQEGNPVRVGSKTCSGW